MLIRIIVICLISWVIPSYAQSAPQVSVQAQAVQSQPARHPEYPTYFAHANGLSIAYQDFGNAQDPAILLVMGLGAQLIHWDDDFVHALVNEGYRVIRFDNRDAGLSEKLLDAGTPGIITFLRHKLNLDLNAPYTLDDMAGDAIGLLDHLQIERAHVVGISMGGMIAQVMTAKFPDRVSSLTSIMSSSGSSDLPEGSMPIDELTRVGSTREELVNEGVRIAKAIYAKPGGRSDQQWYLQSARGYDRSHYTQGTARQLWAILATGDRVESLKSISQPSLVIHGKIDPLIPLEHGAHTAQLISHATYLVIDDMGHYMADEHFDKVIPAMLKTMRTVQITRSAAPLNAATH